jgi:lipopolysaccharide transport system permease protein
MATRSGFIGQLIMICGKILQMNKSVTTYEPDNSIKRGYLSIFLEIFHDIKSNKWLTYQLFKRDFLAIYKQTFVGVMWLAVIPIANVGLFAVLNGAGILNTGKISVPYSIFAVSGILFWQLFSSCIMASCNALVNAGAMIIKINFSKKSLVIASIGQSILAFFVQVVVLGLLFFLYSIKPHITIILIPLFAVPVLLLALGLGFMISLLNGVFRDMANILAFCMTLLMFATPIFYAKPIDGLLAKLTQCNPLYYLISVPRDVILFERTLEWKGFWISSIAAALVFVVCLLVFHLTETRIAERV